MTGGKERTETMADRFKVLTEEDGLKADIAFIALVTVISTRPDLYDELAELVRVYDDYREGR